MLNVNYPYIIKFRLLADINRAYKNAELYHTLQGARSAFNAYAKSDLQGVVIILEEMDYVKHGHIIEADNKVLKIKKMPFRQHI